MEGSFQGKLDRVRRVTGLDRVRRPTDPVSLRSAGDPATGGDELAQPLTADPLWSFALADRSGPGQFREQL
jgi:hypothetical protein